MNTANPLPQVGYLLRSYPRLSQTFVLNEILALEQLGLKIHVFASTNPHEPLIQAQAALIQAPVHYLETALARNWLALGAEHLRALAVSPRRYLKTLSYVLRRSDLDAGYKASSRYHCFAQAVYLARLLQREGARTGRPITHLHAHFAHDPALIALLVHKLTGISYSFTTHARDLYQLPEAVLADRIEAAQAVVTICNANVNYLHEIAPTHCPGKVHLIRHGTNPDEFKPSPRQNRFADPPLIISASRLVKKKGYFDLLHALHQLKQAGRRFRGVIYGDGPLRAALAAAIEQLGLGDDVALAGACTQQELAPALQQADIFALTPFVTEDGDRDGIPTVLFEAMACGLPVVSTAVAGIPELISHDHNGLLTEPHDIEAMAAALASLIDDEARRRQLGRAARQTIVEHFDVRAGARQMAALFAGTLSGEVLSI